MTEWKRSAACATPAVDPDLFHAGERDPQAVKQARTICNRCTQRTACLTAAYKEDDEWGIRAGLTPRQRAANLRKADGNIARAVADALESTPLLLQQIYRHHAQPAPDGHVLWTDHRHWVNVRGTPYTVHRLAWIALHGVEPVGSVTRSCQVEGCVAKGCLVDRRARSAGRKKAAA